MKGLKHKIGQKIRTVMATLAEPRLRIANSITSHLTLEERRKLFELASGKQHILEIGSYVGASAACFGAAATQHKTAKIFCIDTWNNDAMTEGKKDTFQQFQANTNSFKEHIIPVRGFSTDVVDKVSEQVDHLDLLFIDGDHSYEGAKADWDAYRKFLRKGSIVVFHDIGWAEGVVRVVNEDVKPLVGNFGSLPNLWWGTLERV